MALLDSIAPKAAPATPGDRTAPHSIEAEQALLGAILKNNEALDRVSDFLEPEHFYEPVHGQIYDVARALIRVGKRADTITLRTHLPGEVDIAGLTLNQYLARLAAEATTIINAADYARNIYDLFIRRSLISIGMDIVSSSYEAPVDFPPIKQIEEIEHKIYALAEKGKYGGGFERFTTVATRAVDMVAKAYQRDGKLSGVATGLTKLDQLMGGLQPSDLIILAGRPGMGKTALATNIAYNVAKSYQFEQLPDGRRETKNGGVVGFFSLEMSAEQLATRILSERTQIPSHKMRRGSINADAGDFERIKDAAIEIEFIPLYIDETGGLSISQLAARARRLQRQQGLDLLVVDYVQLLQGSSRRAMEGRVQEVTEITSSLKALAKELNIPILALSQLSRQVENRDDKHPQLSDLRESGSIEQDADVVLFVFREEYYHLMRKPAEADQAKFADWQLEAEKHHGKAEVIIAKQRHGPTGTVDLQFEGEVTRFSNLADESRLPEQMT
jgi:replicative DNA helicase